MIVYAAWLILAAILGSAGSERGSPNSDFGHHVGKVIKKVSEGETENNMKYIF